MKGKRATAIVLLGFALLVIAMTWPSTLHLSEQLVGNNLDNWIYYWNAWRLGHAIDDGSNWFTTSAIYYPQGTSLIAHANSHTNSLIALALRPLGGAVFAYNVTVLLGLWLSGVGAYLLVYDLTRRRLAGLVAGFVFAFAPYHVTQSLAHLHLGSIQWWPFFALFLRRALSGSRTWDALAAGLFAALTLWTGFHLVLLLAMWTLCFVAWHLVAHRNQIAWPGMLRTLAVAALAALALGLPLLVPTVESLGELTEANLRPDELVTRQTDLLAYLFPPTHNPLFGRSVAPLYARFVANQAYMPYPGYAVLALTLVAFIRKRRQALFWGLTAALWFALALGPILRVGGSLYPHVPLPYRLVADLAPFSAIRAPDRFNLLLAFSLAVLAGLGTAWLLDQRRRLWLLPLAGLVLIEALCIPFPRWEAMPPASPFLQEMAADETPYAVVNYPMGYDLNKLWLYYQTIHEHPIVQGHFSRYTEEHFDFILSQPLLRALYRGAQQPHYLDLDLAGETDGGCVEALGPAMRSLVNAGVRYVLVHKSYLPLSAQPDPRRLLPLIPAYEDETLAAYDLADPLPVQYDGPPVRIAPSVSLVRFDVQPSQKGAEWRLQVLARLDGPRSTPLDCRVELAGETTGEPAATITLFDGLPIDAAWAAGDLAMEETTLSLPEETLPGLYRWTLVCDGGNAAYTAPETLEVTDEGSVTLLRRRESILYGGAIRLKGYGWRTEGAEVQLTLHWEAVERPDADYKVFVHLLDEAGGIVGQHDAVPCGWQCPTGGWQAGDVIEDRVAIPLWNLPPAEYRLAVGLYDAATGDRLPAADAAGQTIADGYPLLPDAFVIR